MWMNPESAFLSMSVGDAVSKYGTMASEFSKEQTLTKESRVDINIVMMAADLAATLERSDPNMPVLWRVGKLKAKRSIRAITAPNFTDEELAQENLILRKPVRSIRAVAAFLSTVCTSLFNYLSVVLPCGEKALKHVEHVDIKRREKRTNVTLDWAEKRREQASKCSRDLMQRYDGSNNETGKWNEVSDDHPSMILLRELIIFRTVCNFFDIEPEIFEGVKRVSDHGKCDPWPYIYVYHMHPYIYPVDEADVHQITISIKQAAQIIGAISALVNKYGEAALANTDIWNQSESIQVLEKGAEQFYYAAKQGDALNAITLFLDTKIRSGGMLRGGARPAGKTMLELDNHCSLREIFVTGYSSGATNKGRSNLANFLKKSSSRLHDWLHPGASVKLKDLVFPEQGELQDKDLTHLESLDRSLRKNSLKANDPLYELFCAKSA